MSSPSHGAIRPLAVGEPQYAFIGIFAGAARTSPRWRRAASADFPRRGAGKGRGGGAPTFGTRDADRGAHAPFTPRVVNRAPGQKPIWRSRWRVSFFDSPVFQLFGPSSW